MWLSLVERCVRDAKAAGSNPVIPTSMNEKPFEISTFQRVCSMGKCAILLDFMGDLEVRTEFWTV